MLLFVVFVLLEFVVWCGWLFEYFVLLLSEIFDMFV